MSSSYFSFPANIQQNLSEIFVIGKSLEKTWKVKFCLRLTKNMLRLKLGQAQVEVEVEVGVGVGVGVEDGVEVEVILLFRVAGVDWLNKL